MAVGKTGKGRKTSPGAGKTRTGLQSTKAALARVHKDDRIKAHSGGLNAKGTDDKGGAGASY